MNMKTKRSNLQNYQIIQRGPDGYADVPYCGAIGKELSEDEGIIVRVIRETDNLTVLPWQECKVSRKAGETAWDTVLHLPEGGLYRVEATVLPRDGNREWSSRIDCVYHIGVGDIYVMAGQSNMTGYGRDNAFDPPRLGVHSFTRAGEWAVAAHPLCDSLDSPYGYDEFNSGTSPALSFARRLSDALGVPVGLIPAAIGGTLLRQWDPDENGFCYSRMCAMLRDAGTFRGMLWFQGCSDANRENSGTYYTRFCRIVSQWRDRFGDFPLLTVQLNRWAGDGEGVESDREWGTIRDAQRLAALTLPNVSIVPALDLPMSDGIHDGSAANVVIGQRLADTALQEIYHKVGQCAPSILSAERKDATHVILRLTPGHSVWAMDDIAFGMNVEDEGGLIDCTTAYAGPDCLTVETARPFGDGAKFHYAWRKHTPLFPARDSYGMPLLACYGVEIR